jgi:sulfite oxidase
MRTLLKEVHGVDWRDGAVMNCKWRGPRLRDVLLRAGVTNRAELGWSGLHVAFSCFQTRCQDDDWYGGSVGLDTAMSLDAEAILALEVSCPSSSGFFFFDIFAME